MWLVEPARLGDHGDQEAFIAARVSWRIHRVEGIRGDAEIELADIKDRLTGARAWLELIGPIQDAIGTGWAELSTEYDELTGER